MSNKLSPIQTAKFRKFLKKAGCTFNRIKGDHEIWTKPGITRDIVFIANEKEVPPFIIAQNLKTLNISVEEYKALL